MKSLQSAALHACGQKQGHVLAVQPFSAAQLQEHLPLLASWLCVGASYTPLFAEDVRLVHRFRSLTPSTTAEFLSDWHRQCEPADD